MYDKITISGQICTGKTTLFWDLYRKLHWPTFSASLFFRDFAKLHKASLEKAEEQGDKVTKEIDLGMRALLQKRSEIIIEGWMAGLMAKDIPGVLKVLLVCEKNEQIKRFAHRESITKEIARQRIQDRENNLFMTLAKIYKRNDFVNPKNYDLIIDTTNKLSKETLDLVLQALGYFSANGQKPAGA